MRTCLVLGYRNLSRRKSRSLLTMLGIMLAIGFTVGLLSISEGFMKSIDDMFRGGGPDLFIVPKNVSKMPMGFQGTATLDENIAKIIRGIDGIMVVEPVYMGFSAEGGGAGFGHNMTMIAGIPAKDFFSMRPAAVIDHGRMFKDNEGRVVVIGGVVAENLKKGVGDSIEMVTGQKLKIIGVIRKENELFDFFAYSPLKSMQKIFGGEGRASYFMMKSEPGTDIQKTAAVLMKAFPDTDVQTMDDFAKQTKKMLSVARGIHFGVSCFALIIGVLFVACTMIMSVAERVREFATLRVMGAARGFVVRLIITESIILSAIGGIAGCFFGRFLSWLINVLLFHFFGETMFKAFVSVRIFSIGFIIAIIIGAFAGVIPAMMILKRNISESLRYE